MLELILLILGLQIGRPDNPLPSPAPCYLNCRPVHKSPFKPLERG